MRVVVLGASGFLGRHVVPALVGAGHQVVGVARHPPGASPGIEPCAADVLDASSLEHALLGADAVVNLVGIHHGHGAQSFERVHVQLCAQLIDAMQRQSVKRLVHVSVLCARADPRLAYHDSKFRGDERIRASDISWTILRPAIVFAADDGFTTRIRRQIRQRVAPIPGKGDAPQAPVHADDVAAAVERALARPEVVGRVLPLTGLRTLSYAQIVAEQAEREGLRPWMPRVPLGLLRTVAAFTRSWKNPPISEGQLAMISEGMAGDTAESWRALGWEPRGFSAAHLT